jgi:uncharacterized membrane protein YdjX (TVP38/TMEM64 family)
MTGKAADRPGRSPTLLRFLPLIVIVAGLGLALAFGLPDYLSCATLRDNRAWLVSWVDAHRLIAALAFMAIYALAVALSLPGGVALTVTGGFLFGTALATGLVVVAATVGATALFLAARTALGDLLRARAGPWFARLERGFAENALSYLLFLRLVPLFPFFVVNLVPAFLGVTLRTYAIGTFFGIIPGAFVFAGIGAGLGSILDRGQQCTFGNALTPTVLVAFLGLAVLALIPVIYKRWVRPSPTNPTDRHEQPRP